MIQTDLDFSPEIQNYSPSWEYQNSGIVMPIQDSDMSLTKNISSRDVEIKIVNYSDNDLPKYSHEFGDSGMDIRAYIVPDQNNKRKLFIYPNEIKSVNTGLFVEIPVGFEIQIRPRSGLSKIGINLANCVGTIDANYRGELILLVYNFGPNIFAIETGDRIAQIILCPVYRMILKQVKNLSDTERGDGGFGHTGIK